MARILGSRAWPLPILIVVMIVSPTNAHAARIDVNDPSLLGPVLFSTRQGADWIGDLLVSEVRYSGGIYSYVYAVQTSPWFPTGWYTYDGEPTVLSVSVTGHPLGETWGAIYSSNSFWSGSPWPTNTVVLAAAVNSTVVADENLTVGSTVSLPAESIAPGR